MAATKKPAGRSSAARKKAPAKNTGKKSAPPVRREVWAVVLLLLALFSFLGYLNIHAIFIDAFCGVLKGLFGYGFYLVPPFFLWGSVILAFHRGRPVRLRLAAALLLPVVGGALLHIYLCGIDFTGVDKLLESLYDSGLTLTSGGVVCGGLSLACVAVFSRVGTTILLVVGALLLLMTAAAKSPVDIYDTVRNRPPRAEYDPEDFPPEGEPLFPSRRGSVRAPAEFDLPVDDPRAAGKPRPARPAAPAPDPARPTPPEPILDDFSLSRESSMPPVTREPAVGKDGAPGKLKPGEAAAEAAAVAQDIAQSLGQAPPPAYQYPPLSLLDEGPRSRVDGTGEVRQNQSRLEDTLHSFGIDAAIVNVVRGPTVTRYELELDRGVKLNKLTNLSDDIALSLGAQGVRIAPIPGQISLVGIEVPNKLVSAVPVRDVLDSPAFRSHSSKVAFAIGKDISGAAIVGNIAKLPHMLIAGTTGSGKSVCMNSLIVSLLYKATPEEVRMIMIDPKMVELGGYNGIPHLLIPVVTDPKKAAGALQWGVTEMMRRYRTFSEVGVKDLEGYNAYAVKAKDEERQTMPQVVVIIDELADLMLAAAKDVEESVCRIAQMGRAAGVHLIIATQRPSADVITGLMKANIPSRIAFAVASAMESRIILDNTGAEKLVGRGDMLYFPLGSGKPLRVQGCLISPEEIERVVKFVKEAGEAQYEEDVIRQVDENAREKEKGSPAASSSSGGDSLFSGGDELLPAAIDVVMDTGQASVSMLQRRLKLGYARAARIVDEMEERGIVGPFEGSKPRQLLITKEQWQELKLRGGLPAPPAVPDSID